MEYAILIRLAFLLLTHHTLSTAHLLNHTGHTALSATEKETLAEIRDKLEDSDYQSAFQILKRNPLTQLGMLIYWEHLQSETYC
jgi:hypothetical protein